MGGQMDRQFEDRWKDRQMRRQTDKQAHKQIIRQTLRRTGSVYYIALGQGLIKFSISRTLTNQRAFRSRHLLPVPFMSHCGEQSQGKEN